MASGGTEGGRRSEMSGGKGEETKGGQGEEGREQRRRGKCKWFNIVKGYGFITPDDGGTEVFLHQTVIQMPGFRSLAEGEEVEFECRPSDRGFEATMVCGVEGAECRGSDRRPVSKKKHKKLRCYNCGEFASHLAAKCPQGPLPKRCHICKSSDHLVGDCPQRPPGAGGRESTLGGGESSSKERSPSEFACADVDPTSGTTGFSSSTRASQSTAASQRGGTSSSSKSQSSKGVFGGETPGVVGESGASSATEGESSASVGALSSRDSKKSSTGPADLAGSPSKHSTTSKTSSESEEKS